MCCYFNCTLVCGGREISIDVLWWHHGTETLLRCCFTAHMTFFSLACQIKMGHQPWKYLLRRVTGRDWSTAKLHRWQLVNTASREVGTEPLRTDSSNEGKWSRSSVDKYTVDKVFNSSSRLHHWHTQCRRQTGYKTVECWLTSQHSVNLDWFVLRCSPPGHQEALW